MNNNKQPPTEQRYFSCFFSKEDGTTTLTNQTLQQYGQNEKNTGAINR